MPTQARDTNKVPIRGAVLATALLWVGAVHAAPPCGELDNAFGPFDYNDPAARAGGKQSALHVVEAFHFVNPTLGDLDYTLRAFPNHPGALYGLIRIHQQNGGKLGELTEAEKRGVAWPRTIECYFDRAFRFRPQDPVVHMLQAIFLHTNRQYPQALAGYKRARELGLDSSELHYNLGLLYLDMKDYALAKQEAQAAYKKGYPLPGLRNKLSAAGQWP